MCMLSGVWGERFPSIVRAADNPSLLRIRKPALLARMLHGEPFP